MLTRKIKRRALQVGYLACGVIPANIFDEYTKALDERIKSFPESRKFYEALYRNASQGENAKSVVVCTRRFNNHKVPGGLDGLIAKCYLFDIRVEYSPAYRARAEFEAYLKTLGLAVLENRVPQRLAAAKAGVGKFGRNNFIFDSQHGSNIWIDTWVVDKALEYDEVEKNIYQSACNDGCHKCIESCPTKALSGVLSMNMGRCITRISTAGKDVPDEGTRTQMGKWLYGCDACQDVCPLNKDKFTESDEYPLLAEQAEYLTPERILEMDEDTYRNVVNPRFWYAGEDALWFWKCNALRCMINSGEEKYHSLIERCLDHEDSRIKEVARRGVELRMES